MSILHKSYEYLEKIILKEDSFTDIVNRLVNNDTLKQDEISSIRDIIKSTVNKYYFIQYEVTSLYENHLTNEERNVLILCVAMYHYVKNMSLEIILSCFNQDEASFKTIKDFNLTSQDVSSFLTKLGPNPIKIPEKFDKFLIRKKVALLYSYPEWIVKMMIKHFGFKNAFKSIASSRKSAPLVININPMTMTFEELDDRDFVKSSLAYTAYNYIGKEKIINHKLFKQNKIFVEDEASQYLVDVLNPLQGDDILFVGDSKGVMPLDATLRSSDFANIKVACDSIISLNTIRKIVKRFDIKSVKPFVLESIEKDYNKEENSSYTNLLITYVEPNKFDKVMVIPKSTSLGLVRKHPDVLLTLKKEDIDIYIENQKKDLLETSKFVKNGGSLIYVVFTMNHKESDFVIKDFLANNLDFKLDEEKQIFPYDGPCDGFYYAKLIKEEKND